MKKFKLSVFFILIFVKAYSQAVNGADSQYTEVTPQYAESLMNESEYEKAEKAYEILLKQNPDNRDLLYNLGIINYQLKRNEKARGYFKRCVELIENLRKGLAKADILQKPSPIRVQARLA